MNGGTALRTVHVVVALAVGGLLAIPAGWLLAILALLPFFLGLFFSLVVGLLLGAVVYRLARPAAPLASWAAVFLGGVVFLTAWTTGLACEYLNTRGYDLPWYHAGTWRWVPVDGDATRAVRGHLRHRSLTVTERELLRTRTRQVFARQIAVRYPPGGFMGFLRWSAAGQGALEIPRVFGASPVLLNPKQRGVTWLIRLALSLILLGFAVLSQVLCLARESRPSDDEPPPRPEPGHASTHSLEDFSERDA